MAAPLSPISPLPSVGQTLAVTAGTPAEVPVQPFANTEEVLILNLDTTAANIVYVQWVDITATGVLPAALAPAASTQVPASSAVTLAIGVEGDRHQIGTVAWWAANPGSNIVLVLDAAAGAPGVNVTYIQGKALGD